MRGGLHGSGWPLAILTIACLLYTLTGRSQTSSKPEQQKMPTSGEKPGIVTKSVLQCPSAGSQPAASLKGHHKVTLTWKASPGKNVVGYCLYRSTQKNLAKNKPNTPFNCVGCEQINTVPVKSTACVDDAVPDKSTYFYVATAIDDQKKLSPASNEARADIGDGSPRPSPQQSTYTLCRDASSSK